MTNPTYGQNNRDKVVSPRILQDVPSANEVNRFHTNADRDVSTVSLHHTLGIGHNQASPGSHNHDGKNSKRVLEGKMPSFPTLANPTYSATQMQQVIDALRQLGAGS